MPIWFSEGQQIWEALAILVAVDIWTNIWAHNRIVLNVKGDNVGALTLLIKMRPDGPNMAIIALHLVEVSFPPDATHTHLASSMPLRINIQSLRT